LISSTPQKSTTFGCGGKMEKNPEMEGEKMAPSRLRIHRKGERRGEGPF
jgi:hypothetical protein